MDIFRLMRGVSLSIVNRTKDFVMQKYYYFRSTVKYCATKE